VGRPAAALCLAGNRNLPRRSAADTATSTRAGPGLLYCESARPANGKEERRPRPRELLTSCGQRSPRPPTCGGRGDRFAWRAPSSSRGVTPQTSLPPLRRGLSLTLADGRRASQGKQRPPAGAKPLTSRGHGCPGPSPVAGPGRPLCRRALRSFRGVTPQASLPPRRRGPHVTLAAVGRAGQRTGGRPRRRKATYLPWARPARAPPVGRPSWPLNCRAPSSSRGVTPQTSLPPRRRGLPTATLPAPTTGGKRKRDGQRLGTCADSDRPCRAVTATSLQGHFRSAG
jgi:hypothetical protein